MPRITKTANDNNGGKRYSWGTLEGVHPKLAGQELAWPRLTLGAPANDKARPTRKPRKK